LLIIVVQQIFGFPNFNATFMNHQPLGLISQNPSLCRHFEKSNIIKFHHNAYWILKIFYYYYFLNKVLMNSSFPCVAIASNVHRTQEAKVLKSSCWQRATMANNGHRWCDSDRQFRVLSGMQGDDLTTWCSSH
jgi:hypothetical protein